MQSVAIPTVLYHYTSAAGLFGILENSVLWASNIHYLNDSKEFRHAIECANQVLFEETQALDPENRASIRNHFNERLERLSRLSILVASLSENGDALSQWRGYCPSGGAYAIGFDREKLAVLAHQQQFRLLPCSYSRSEHLGLIRPLIKPLLEADAASLDAAIDRFAALFVQLAPLMKNESFAEEREWRLISGLFRTDRSDWKIRVGRTMLIPYTEFKIGTADESALREVVIGPMSHQLLASASVCGALNKAKIKDWATRNSQSSYRDW